MPAKTLNGSEKFLRLLEREAKKVLAAKDATHGERLAAISAGCKLLVIRYRIELGDEGKGFFGQS